MHAKRNALNLTAGILVLGIGLICLRAQQMPQDYWVLEGIKVQGSFYSITIGPDGLFYTGGNSGTTVSVYDTNFVQLRQFGSFSAIRGIVVNSQTNVYVVDAGQSKIKVFDAQGLAVREFGSLGTNDGEFCFVSKVGTNIPVRGIDGDYYYTGISGRCGTMAAIDNQDRLYVTDTANLRVQVFDSEGNFLRKWGGSVGLPESLVFPRSILALPQDRILVWGANRWCCGGYDDNTGPILAFDTNGRFLSSKSTQNGGGLNMALTPDGLVGVDSQRYTWGNVELMDSELNVIFSGGGGPSGGVRPGGFPTSLAPVGIPGVNGNFGGFVFDRAGDFCFIWHGPASGIYVMNRKFKVDSPLVRNRIPHPSIRRTVQRTGTSLIDIDFGVVDADSASIQAAMLAFVDGGNSLGSLVKMSTFTEGTQANLGANIPANTTRRVTWDVGSDWPVGFGNLKFEILAKDERGLLPFHFITVPESPAGSAFTMSHQPVNDDDLLSLWFWLVANSDPAVSLANGQLKAVGGSFDGQTLANGSTTTAAGRSFLFERLNVRTPTSTEISRAQSGRYGFGTVNANSVIKLP